MNFVFSAIADQPKAEKISSPINERKSGTTY